MKPFFSIFTTVFVLLMHGCGGGGSTSQEQENNNIDSIPVILTIAENTTIITTIHSEGEAPITYTIGSGDDGMLFTLNELTGKLKFNAAPNFEKPSDTNQDNLYKLTVKSTDATDHITEYKIEITVTDINESSSEDSDDDYIPDNIEIMINSDINKSDENNNTIIDGLESEGEKGDTFFDMQWYINSLGNITNESGIASVIGNDLNLLEIYHRYMGYNHGENIIVQVVDLGVEADHEDLESNMDLSRSYNGENVGDPSGYQTHGTKVAGIIAARAFNGKGVRGIIPFAKIAGSDWLKSQTYSALEKAWLTGEGANEIAVTNNSWGSDFDTETFYEEIMALGTSSLREGKGRIYIFAAGNSRDSNSNANLQYMLSNRFTITVAGLKHDNTYAAYSNPGSNIFVSGYSGNYYQDSPTIGTTTNMGFSSNSGDINTMTTWSDDINENYTFAMNGTSAAAPTVAASIALVLEACPDLAWRDIKYLTALHAQKIDSNNSTWVQNHAGHWHSIDYGFGLINAQGMIDECTSGYINLENEQHLDLNRTFDQMISDDQTTYTFELNATENLTIEWIEVTIDNDNRYASDYRVELISPFGTRTTLMQEDSNAYGNWMHGGFRLSSAAFIDESSQGTWHVEMTDMLSLDSGTLKNIQIKIYGH